MKKMLSLTMAAMMAATMLPTSAFANNTNQTGWEYNAGSTIVNKIKQQKIVGQYDIGVGTDAQQNFSTSTANSWQHGGLYYDESNDAYVLDRLTEDQLRDSSGNVKNAVDVFDGGSINTTNKRFDPWDIAADNAPEVHLQVSGYSVGAEGVLNDAYPYMLSEIDVEISDASLVKVNQAWFDEIVATVNNKTSSSYKTNIQNLVYNLYKADIISENWFCTPATPSGEYGSAGSAPVGGLINSVEKYGIGVKTITDVEWKNSITNLEGKNGYRTISAANIDVDTSDFSFLLDIDNYSMSDVLKTTDLAVNGQYPVVPLDEVDITHLISITREGKTQRVSTLIGNGTGTKASSDLYTFLSDGKANTTYNTSDYTGEKPSGDEFPDFYVKNIQTSNMGGGVYGVSSFTLEVRSYDGFDENIVEGVSQVTEKSTFDPFNNGGSKYQGTYVGGSVNSRDLSNNKVFGSIQQYDIISIKLPTWMKSSSRGTASVDVYSPTSNGLGIDETFDYATLVDSGLNVSYSGKTLDTIAEEEIIRLTGDIIIKESAAGSFGSRGNSEEVTTTVEFKINRGFEFEYYGEDKINPDRLSALQRYTNDDFSSDSFTLTIERSAFTDDVNILEELRIKASTILNDITYYGLGIEATTANVGDIAEITVSIDGVGYGTVQVAEVVDYSVLMYTDSSADVPTMFSGVNRDNDGLSTDSNQNYSAEVTIEETFPGAWEMSGGFNLNLPEGVHVVNKENYTYNNRLSDSGVNVINVGNLEKDGVDVTRENLLDVMRDAYNGTSFEFAKRSFDSVDHTLYTDVATMTLQFILTADYDFEGPVTLELDIANNDNDPEPVVIANFIKPFTITAEQNDTIIDYRYTSINTPVVFTEYEAGLLVPKLGEHNNIYATKNANWENIDGTQTYAAVNAGSAAKNDKDDVKNYINFEAEYMNFEDAGSLEMDGTSDGSMKLSLNGNNNDGLDFGLTVSGESRYAPMEATVTGLELFMDRTIPAGAYYLGFQSSMINAMRADFIFGSEDEKDVYHGTVYSNGSSATPWKYTEIIHDSWVNVITAGTDKDNTFLTRISATVGADYITAGEKTIDLSSTEGGATPPPYINENDRMMVPVRAVTEALGDSGIMVTWDQEGKAVGIIYPDRVISIVLGENIATVNGTRIALNEKLEMKNDRVFLPFRDLGNLLGVSDADIVWDNVTRTAIINATNTDKANIDAGTATTDVVVESEEEVEVEEVVTTEEV